MKPDFALSMSFEGITLLQRAAGGWRRVGEVALEEPDLGAALAKLRARAEDIGAGKLTTKIILPNDQIRYLSVETGTFEGDTREEIVRSALASATPYALDELAFDLCPDGAVTHVAAVARETMAEAEAFANENNFAPVSFVAVPGDQGFLGEPYFGESSGARGITGGEPVEADGIAVVVIGDVFAPEPEETPEPDGAETTPGDDPASNVETAPEEDASPPAASSGPEETAQSAPADETQGDTPPPQFSSRRERRKQIRAERRAARQDAADEGKENTADAPARRLTLQAEPAAPSDETPVSEPPAPAEPPAPSEPVDDHPVAVGIADAGIAEPHPVGDAPVAPEPEIAERHANVTAPVLDIPDFADADDEAGADSDGGKALGFGRFLSRRRPRLRVDPVPPATPGEDLPAPAPAPASAMPITLPPAQVPQDEAARMTVFGARQPDQVGGKPRHLGLLLTAVLLAFLAGVAAWASLFLEDGVAGLFDFGSDAPQIAVAPETPRAPTPAVLSTDPTVATAPDAPTSAPPTAPAPVVQSEPSAQPTLSETDIAVLDALQSEVDTVPSAETLPPEAVTAVPLEAPDAPGEPEQIAALPPVLPDDPEASFDGENTDGAQALYAATGIWPNAPVAPTEPGVIGLDDLFVAAIDRTDLAQDAVALPAPSDLDTDRIVSLPALPTAPGTRFALDPSGLVEPSAQGTLNPDGILIFAGRPPVRPGSYPVRFETEPEIDALRQRLAELRPRARPGDLLERAERSQLGGRTRDELAEVRPRLRPASLQETAQSNVPEDQPPTAQAVARSLRPDARPASFAARVARAAPAPSTNARPEPGSTPAATVSPRIPTTSSVARQATLNNAINLRRINLIGVYGSPANRRALVRLPSGRYKKVKVGDSMDGGRVLAISDSELRYQKGGRNVTLKIPSG